MALREFDVESTNIKSENSGRNGRRQGSLAGDFIKGAVAGAVGVWAMDQMGWKMYLNEDPKAFEQEKESQVEGKYASHVMVGKVADSAGKGLSEAQQHRVGKFAHYMLGVLPGAGYGALRKRVPGLDTGAGLLYGLGLFIVIDELTNPLLGFSSGPTDYPWQAHARGFVTHLVLGTVTDATLEVLDQLT